MKILEVVGIVFAYLFVTNFLWLCVLFILIGPMIRGIDQKKPDLFGYVGGAMFAVINFAIYSVGFMSLELTGVWFWTVNSLLVLWALFWGYFIACIKEL